MYEIDGIKEEMARQALEKAGDKLPIKAKFIRKEA